MRVSLIARFSLLSITVLLGVCPYRRVEAGPIVVNDGDSIVSATNSASEGDVIEIRSNGTFSERLGLRNAPEGITVRAGSGFSPTLEGSSSTDWTNNVPVGQENLFVFLDADIHFIGIRFRVDVTNLEAEKIARGYQLLNITGPGRFEFTNCTFEFTGQITDKKVVGRDMIRLQGPSDTVFQNCNFRYTTNVIAWPAFNNTVGYFQPSGATLSARFHGCRFDAVTDSSGQARSIGAGPGGADGESILEINDCEFGLHRSDSRQYQQAYIFPALSDAKTTVRGCVFPAGANRYLGLGSGLTIEAERCLFMNPHIDLRGGFIYGPDSDGALIESTNCVFMFVSRLGIPFRGHGDADDCRYEFHHCTFHDLSGNRAESLGHEPALLEVSNTSPVHEFHACIFNVPGFSRHLLVNRVSPGRPAPVLGSDNLIHSAEFPLSDGILPPEAFAVIGDPLLNSEDGFHLLPDSPAIDAVTEAGTGEDFDGHARPYGASTDIGAHEFEGAVVTRSAREIHIPGDASTLAEATALANRNFDEIVIDRDGPFFETMRGERYQSHLTVRAGEGVKPMLVVDAATTDVLDVVDSVELATMSEIATPFLLSRTGRFEGLHWRLDLTDMEAPVPPHGLEPRDLSMYLLLLRSDYAHFEFERCTFELFGNARPGHESIHGLRPTVFAEGAPRCTFTNCGWIYNMDLIEWPGHTAAGFGYRIPWTGLLEVTLNDCRFAAVPDSAGRARHVAVFAGLGGEVELQINRCRFGEGRSAFDEPGETPLNRQFQQAHVILAGHTTRATINDSVFLNGAGRQIGLGNQLDAFVNRCVFEPTTVGNALLPDAGGGEFFVTNSVIRFDSLSYAKNPSLTAPIRGEGFFGDRVFQFVHCLFQDVNGIDGAPNVGLMSIDDSTGSSGARTNFENCIIDMPAATKALFDNTETTGNAPFGRPLGSGNLKNTGELQFPILPRGSLIRRGSPRWDLDQDDLYHLSDCSIRAIDRVERPTVLDVTTDIDGDPRPYHDGESGDPLGRHYDVGPDEFTGILQSPEFCGVSADAEFRRGDHDVNGFVDITDAFNLLVYLFIGERQPQCFDATDVDNSSRIDITDAVNLLTFLFLGAVILPAPGLECGMDPAFVIPAGDGLPEQPDVSLGCDFYDQC